MTSDNTNTPTIEQWLKTPIYLRPSNWTWPEEVLEILE